LSGHYTLSLDRKIAVDPYNENRYTGSFIIIDRYTNNTVGAGMILSAPTDYIKQREDYFYKVEILQNGKVWYEQNIS